MPVPGGPLDNAAFLTIPDDKGIPVAYTVPIEVKNIREWVYGRSRELNQLLYKAAKLQIANPGVPMVPLLVCRRRQESTRRLGMEVGFYSVQYRTQLLQPLAEIALDSVTEVQTELGYEDLRLSDAPNGALLKALRESVPRDAARTAERWSMFAPDLVDHFDTLRRPLTNSARAAAWAALRQDLRDRDIHLPEE